MHMSNKPQLRVVMAQVNLMVGEIEANGRLVIERSIEARDRLQADLVLFPELTLTGYPPEDLLLRPDLQQRVARVVEQIKSRVSGITVVCGLPQQQGGRMTNGALVIQDGEVVAYYAKQHLPNYGVFDEVRYFVAGSEAATFSCRGVRCGLSICEDIWYPDSAAQAVAAGAELLLNLNASPFHQSKLAERESVVAARAAEVGVPILYTNLVGGQDELVFDGGSFVVDATGTVTHQAPMFVEAMVVVALHLGRDGVEVVAGECIPEADPLQLIYQALALGVRDYVNKNGFPGVVIGLSGGIDSALTLAIAVDALGADRVEGVSMPSIYTAAMSREDAAAQAQAQGVRFSEIAIKGVVDEFTTLLAPAFAGYGPDTTEENLQARCRGIILMAISNKRGSMVLTTGNKSEMAVGYATLYGDMAGGFAVLKDLPKTLVYRLAHYRNSLGAVIPQRVIDRPPSAELAPDQQDSDSLPPYDVLDQILALYVEQDYSPQQIMAAGFAEQEVRRVVRLVDINEYKRRQAAPGVKVTRRAFGRGRRYPITSGFGRGY